MKKIVDVSLKNRYPLLERRGNTIKEKVKLIDVIDNEMGHQKPKNVCAYCRVSTDIPHQIIKYVDLLSKIESYVRLI